MTPRGRVFEVNTLKGIKFNERLYLKVVIELDHINFGISKKNKCLNTTRRSNFSVNDVLTFFYLLDDVELVPIEEKELMCFFVLELQCPVSGPNYGKIFRVVFSTSKHHPDIITIITLYRI